MERQRKPLKNENIRLERVKINKYILVKREKSTLLRGGHSADKKINLLTESIMNPIAKAFAANNLRLHRGSKSRSGGVQRVTCNEYIANPDGSLTHIGSKTAPKRVLARCYRNLARTGWL